MKYPLNEAYRFSKVSYLLNCQHSIKSITNKPNIIGKMNTQYKILFILNELKLAIRWFHKLTFPPSEFSLLSHYFTLL